jgi:O-antigen/teichoic acid export membrane protein
LNIFWKEIAEAHHGGNTERVAALYRKVSRILYMVGATIAGFLLPWTEDILRLLLGPSYAGAALAMAIMFLYPVHQSMGQVGGIMLYATGRVRAKALSGIGIMLASILVSYFVLAPREAVIPGMGLASTGLAIKMVAMQFISVNIIAFLIARGLGVAFDWLYQLVGLGIAVLAGWAAHALSTALAGENWPLLGTIVLAGFIYAAFLACALLAMPWLVDARRSTLTGLLFHR